MPDYALLAIPAFTILTIAPHFYAVSTVSKAAKWSNANSRGSSEIASLKKQLPASTFATYERAEAAHKNSLEAMPLFIAAVLTACFAEKVTRTDVGNARFAAVYLGMRAVYALLYVNTTSEKYSHLRSMTWTASVFLCFYQIYKAAVALA